MKILAMTGAGGVHHEAVEALGSLTAGLLAKPFTAGALLNAVAQLLPPAATAE